MFVMGKTLKLRKMWGVIISEDKVILLILKMIAIARMPNVLCFNDNPLVQLQ
jgi:hypothetical protein